LRDEAAENLRGIANIELVGDLNALTNAKFDTVYCLEVFEHLARRNLRRLVRQISGLLGRDARLVVGVPNELYAVAAAKGLFRMVRRYGQFDAQPMSVARAALGSPPRRRLRASIGPGLPYYPHHLGFDYRALARVLSDDFDIVDCFGSPLSGLPLVCNAEVYFVCQKRIEAVSRAA